MKMTKCKKRIAMGAAGLLMAGTIFACDIMSSVVEVQATTRVLDGITVKYSPTSNIKILEITDYDGNDSSFTFSMNGKDYAGSENSELGYFMPTSNTQLGGYKAGDDNSSPSVLTAISKGYRYGKPENLTYTKLEYTYTYKKHVYTYSYQKGEFGQWENQTESFTAPQPDLENKIKKYPDYFRNLQMTETGGTYTYTYEKAKCWWFSNHNEEYDERQTKLEEMAAEIPEFIQNFQPGETDKTVTSPTTNTRQPDIEKLDPTFKVQTNETPEILAANKKYLEQVLPFYTYGLVKPNGTDTGWVSHIGEYPIYGKGAIFSSYQTKSCSAPIDTATGENDVNFTMGVYMPVNGTGSYRLKPSYVTYVNGQEMTYNLAIYVASNDPASTDVLAEGITPASVKDYTICTYTTETRTVQEEVTVSDNSVSGNEGGTHKEMVDVEKEFRVFKPITVDSSVLDYPSVRVTDADGKSRLEKVIERAPEQNGNLSFMATEITTTTPYQEYYGPNNLTGLWFNVGGDNDNKFKNSGWFYEYVLGSNKVYQDTDAIYDVVPAKQVKVKAAGQQHYDLDAYDLIYISGTASGFAKCDLSEDVVVAIYNNTTNHLRQAVMMDYACYSGSIKTKTDVLAALLWQTKDTRATLYNADAGRAKNDQMFTVADGKFNNKVTGQEQTYTEHVLKSYAQAEAAVKNGFSYTIETKGENGASETTQKKMDPLKKTMMDKSFGNGNFVTGNVYVYDHARDNFDQEKDGGPKSFVDAHDNFANGDFKTSYATNVVATGLSAVETYITTQNKNSLNGAMSTEVTPAVCIQYILVSDGEDIVAMKTSLEVLEIQPVPAYLYNTGHGSEEYLALSDSDDAEKSVKENRKKFVEDYLPQFYADKLEYIGFTSMTVSEFNGHNEDLIESYDIIYIGDETGKGGKNFYNSDYRNGGEDGSSGYVGVIPFNDKEHVAIHKRKSNVWSDKDNCYLDAEPTDLSYFTDQNMVGNIYYNVGDTVKVRKYRWSNTSYLYGWLKQEDLSDGDADGFFNVRYAGRDITSQKLKKMKQFVDSKGLVIVAENLMGPKLNVKGNEQVNPTIVSAEGATIASYDLHGFVDSSSNLYEFLQYGLGYRWDGTDGTYKTNDGTNAAQPAANMVSAASIKLGHVDKGDLTQYVSSEKVMLLMYSQPKPYSYTTKTVNGVNGVIDDITYLDTVDADGVRYLQYEFEISSDASVLMEEKDKSDGTAHVEAGYRPALYIDINNDGKYSKVTEEVADIIITCVNAEGQTVEAKKNADGSYNLDKGTRYTLRRDLSDDFRGLINWKLSVENVYLSTLHASEQGYTAVKGKKKKVINVLQINRLVEEDTNGDGIKEDVSERSSLQNFLTCDTNNAATPAGYRMWNAYMTNIPDYELHVRTMLVEDFQTDFDEAYNRRAATYPDDPGINAMTAEEFASKYYFKDLQIDDEQTGVSMLVTAFGDAYNSFTNDKDNAQKGYNAVAALYTFINEGNPVLASHDFLDVKPDHLQSKFLRELYGQDKYGMTKNISTVDGLTQLTARWDLANKGAELNVGSDATHSNTAYTWGNNAAQMEQLETMKSDIGKEIAYEPNKLRRTTTKYTQGFSNYVVSRIKKKDALLGNDKHASAEALWYINRPYANLYGEWSDGVYVTYAEGKQERVSDMVTFAPYEVDKLNDGQITTYPYLLPDKFEVTTTHGQWHELDLSTDADRDGESDLVVWYTLGENKASWAYMNNPDREEAQRMGGYNFFSDKEGASTDPANGYYIYNKGNVTYTGAGHSAMWSASEQEAQLFVNTLLATFEVSNNEPTIGIYETSDINAKPINSIVVPYDANVTKPGQRGDVDGVTRTNYDSSVLLNSDNRYKYQFVDPNTQADTIELGTMAYFRIRDLNFVRGEKQITVKYYLVFDNVEPATIVTVNSKTSQNGQPKPTTLLETPDGTYTVVDISQEIETYDIVNGERAAEAKGREQTQSSSSYGYVDTIESNRPYGIYLPMNYLNDNARFTILVEAETKITSVSSEGVTQERTTEKGYQKLTVTKADLLDLD